MSIVLMHFGQQYQILYYSRPYLLFDNVIIFEMNNYCCHFQLRSLWSEKTFFHGSSLCPYLNDCPTCATIDVKLEVGFAGNGSEGDQAMRNINFFKECFL